MTTYLKKSINLDVLEDMPKKDVAELILKVYDQTYRSTRQRTGEILMEDYKKSGLVKKFLKMNSSDNTSSYMDTNQVTPSESKLKWTNIS